MSDVGRLCAVALLVIASVGCGGTYDATVSGSVTLDGQPLTRGTVKFIPDGAGAPGYGLVGGDGSYSLMTGREAGISSGAYTVTVVANAPSTPDPNSPSSPPMPGKPITPVWYRDAESSPIKETVEPGSNEISLSLTSTPPAGWKPPGRR
jgi:hypothetical protein